MGGKLSYGDFVMQGIDKETEIFHRKSNMAAIFGDKAFKEWVYEALLPELGAERKSRVVQPDFKSFLLSNRLAESFRVRSCILHKIQDLTLRC
jgi:putative transposase